MEKKCKVVVFDKNPLNTGQYLYILSDDEIKEGDWVLRVDRNEIWKVNRLNTSIDTSHLPKRVFKVIATTNLYLIELGVASIDDEFIREYCSNPVDEVLVEYIIGDDYLAGESNGNEIWNSYPDYLKLSSNGSIIIKPVEETWDDVRTKYSEYKESIKNQPDNHKQWRQKVKAFDRWLEENYEAPKKKQT